MNSAACKREKLLFAGAKKSSSNLSNFVEYKFIEFFDQVTYYRLKSHLLKLDTKSQCPFSVTRNCFIFKTYGRNCRITPLF